MTAKHKKFPKTYAFKNVWQGIEPEAIMIGKVKLHGTNAAIQLDSMAAQSRSRILGPEDDNLGFFAFVDSLDKEAITSSLSGVTVYGEWCGPGIQKGVACSQIPHKLFAIFAVMKDDLIYYSSDDIRSMISIKSDRIKIIPEYSQLVMPEKDDIQAFVESINNSVLKVEKEDPFILAEFGISGEGEGLFFAPPVCARDSFDKAAFKAKAEKHRVQKQKKSVTIAPEKLRGAQDFAKNVVTEPRFQQALGETCKEGLLDKNIGSFLRWIVSDAMTEGADEISANGLNKKLCSKACGQLAIKMFRAAQEEKFFT